MSFKPEFNCTFDAYTGFGQSPPFQNLWMGEPCALWHSRGRVERGRTLSGPPVHLQLAVAINRNVRSYFGWLTPDGVWSIPLADWWIVNIPGSTGLSVQPVYEGPMWAGTPDAHWRYSCTLALNTLSYPVLSLYPPQGLSGQPLPGGRTGTFDIYRPFGAAVPTLVAAPGVIYPDPYGGRGSYSGGNYLTWSDILDCQDTVDIRDGLTRASGLDSTAYSDGDEVRWPTGIAVTRYVVVKVTRLTMPDGTSRKRVHLLRDQAHWPGP